MLLSVLMDLPRDGQRPRREPLFGKGIMARNNSVLDNLIPTNIKSIWKSGHDQLSPADGQPGWGLYPVPGLMTPDSLREITSLLIQYRNPLAGNQLPRYINSKQQVASSCPGL